MKEIFKSKLILGIICGALVIFVIALIQMQEWLFVISGIATITIFVYLAFFREKKYVTHKQIIIGLFCICFAFMGSSVISVSSSNQLININYNAWEKADKSAKDFEKKYNDIEKETSDWRRLSETEKALQVTESEARKKEADEKAKAEKEAAESKARAEKEEADRVKAEQERAKKEEEARNKVYKTGTYKVGVDIPAGEYKISQGTGTAFYWQISTDANGSDIIENEFSQGEGYFSCSDGQYVKIQGEAKLV